MYLNVIMVLFLNHNLGSWVGGGRLHCSSIVNSIGAQIKFIPLGPRERFWVWAATIWPMPKSYVNPKEEKPIPCLANIFKNISSFSKIENNFAS